MSIKAAGLFPAGAEMNGVETRFWEEELRPGIMSGELAWVGYESLRLKLGRRVTYTPDFVVIAAKTGHVTLYEVKETWVSKKHPRPRAGWRGDARAKFLVAAAAYPFFEFVAVNPQTPDELWTLKCQGVTDIGWHRERPAPTFPPNALSPPVGIAPESRTRNARR